MAITWADVVAAAPELASASAGTQTFILTAVAEEVDPEVWGTRADRGKVYLAAHLGTLAKMEGAGAASSQRVGPLGETRAIPKGGISSLSLGLTSYGAEYERLCHTLESVVGDAP